MHVLARARGARVHRLAGARLRSPAAVVLMAFVVAGVRAANHPPAAPVITEPTFDPEIVNAQDVHMETGPFSDPDPGDQHRCTTWQIWSLSPLEPAWQCECISGVQVVHVHLGDGEFLNSHAGRTSLLPDKFYGLRVRHRDDSGDPASEWSPWSWRIFLTDKAAQVPPLELRDVAYTPPPVWQTLDGAAVVLPAGDSPATLRLESAAGALLAEWRGAAGSVNQFVNPNPLTEPAPLRLLLTAPAAAPLSLPATNVYFTDDVGTDRVLYLPACDLAANEETTFWVAANGGTFVAEPDDAEPHFEHLARSPDIPWTVRPGYRMDRVATGFQLPVNIAFVPQPGPDPDDPLFYVAELYGAIKVVTRAGAVSTYADNLLNFDPTGNFPGSGEQGLAGLAVDPLNGDLYASLVYDAAPPDGPHYPKVVRFTSTDGGFTADTQVTILDMAGEVQGESHQVSHVSFGPDNRLYVHNGDGFDAATAQNLDSFRGKILRLERDGAPPDDNPFFDALDGITARDYVYAYGFRNPFGGAWRTRDNHLYEVENGPSVDRLARVVPGVNYLWDGSDQSMLNGALYAWYPIHAPVNIAFIQPNVFAGSGFPVTTWHNAFVSESGPTWAGGAVPNGKSISEFPLDAGGALRAAPTPLVKYNGFGKATAVALAAGPDGLYFSDLYKDLDYGSPIDPGANIWRIRFVGDVTFIASVQGGAAPLSVRFTPISSVPNPTGWLWDFGDGTFSTQPRPLHTFHAPGAYHVRLTVFGVNGPVTRQRNDFVRVAPRVALIGGSLPPSAADAALAEYLTAAGCAVVHFDDEPASRPSAGELAESFSVAIVSASVYAPNIAGEFNSVPLPLILCEPALLRAGEEPLAASGTVVPAARVLRIIADDHPVTAGLPLGFALAYTAAAPMSIGTPPVGPGVRVLGMRGASTTDAALITAAAGATLADGSSAPARRVFLFFSDESWLQATPLAQSLLARAVAWTTAP